MNRTATTLWNSCTSWLVWASPLSLALVAVNDCIFPLPSLWLFLLGIVWLLVYLGGAFLKSGGVCYKALSTAVMAGFLYSLYLIDTVHRPDNAIRRDLAEVRIGSSVEAERLRMAPHREGAFGEIYYEIFNPPDCDAVRAYYYWAPGADEACIVAIGFKD